MPAGRETRSTSSGQRAGHKSLLSSRPNPADSARTVRELTASRQVNMQADLPYAGGCMVALFQNPLVPFDLSPIVWSSLNSGDRTRVQL